MALEIYDRYLEFCRKITCIENKHIAGHIVTIYIFLLVIILLQFLFAKRIQSDINALMGEPLFRMPFK